MFPLDFFEKDRECIPPSMNASTECDFDPALYILNDSVKSP